MTVRASGNIIRFYLILLIFCGFSGVLSAQVIVNGNVKNIRGANKYPHTAVTAFTAANKITVSNATGFQATDTVLLIQMQGVVIDMSAGSYGEYVNQYGNPGRWEFIIISGVSGSEITFSNNIKGTYDILGSVQIVKVPSFKSSATVSVSDLYCDDWDPVTKSGGVLPIIVSNTLRLETNIDVSARGLRGGTSSVGLGNCAGADPEYFAATYNNAGFKGEGIAIHGFAFGLLLPNAAKGSGPNFTGGGGGNGAYPGGGGGSNRGNGGVGGTEKGCPQSGGKGGNIADHPLLQGSSAMFMGGGGGASTRSASGISGDGGHGGGIIIIIANKITGAGGHILAKGGSGANASGGANSSGAAGGGGGGTIAMSVLNYEGTFNADVSGGKGGDNIGRTYGEGGGGGGGLIWLTTDNAGNLNPVISGGISGSEGSGNAGSGNPGEKRIVPAFNPNLNGFLFNSVSSSISGTKLDYSCSNNKPPKILGTVPVGGTAPYNVTWQLSTDAGFTAPIDVATGVAIWDYTPAIDDTLKRSGSIFFRRKIVDSSIPTTLTDISLPVEVVIQPSIKGYWVGPPDTICFAQNPPTVGPIATVTGGNGTFTYKWMVSTNNITFTAPSGNTGASYTPPPALTADSWYRRTVYSGACADSAGIVKIKVLPNIGSNSITPPLVQEICNGSAFNVITASNTPTLTGGDGSYRFKWISSNNAWGAAPDVSTNADYSPLAASFPLGTTVSLRRVVFSGIHDVCKDTTTVATIVKLTRWPVISNNVVTADQTIGYDSIPLKLVENPVPGMTGGNGTYAYTWQKDTLAWANAPGTFNLTDYQAPALKVTTRFRRYVTSSACTSISNTITITVHAKITNTISLAVAANDTIATGSGPGFLNGSVPTGGSGIPGDYSFKWFVSNTGGPLAAEWTVIGGAVSQNHDPGVLTAVGAIKTYYFRRDVSSPIVSPTSTYKSNIIKVVVLPVLQNYNITVSTAKCAGQRPDWLKGVTPVTGGDGIYKYTWQDSTSLHDFQDIAGFIKCDSLNYKPPVLTSGAAYRRITWSGKNYTLLSSTSNISRVKVNPLPTAVITSVSDTSICGGTAAKVMVSLTGATKFRVTMKENGTDLAEVPNITGPNYNFSLVKTPVNPSELYNYQLSKVIDQNNCQNTVFAAASRNVTVYKQPVSNAGPDVDAWCGPNIKLNGSAPVLAGGGTWTWKKVSVATGPGSAVFANANDRLTRVDVDSLTAAWGDANKYRFYWTDINGVCSSKDSVDITFNKRVANVVFPVSSKAIFHLDKQDTLPSIALTVGSGLWSPASNVRNGNIAYNMLPGENLFIYTVTNGACQDTGHYTIYLFRLEFPEGFSPNGDGVNDKFEITGLDTAVNFITLRIINSAGTEVYFTSNENGGTFDLWDGTSKGKDLPEGTYYYLISIASRRDTSSRATEKGFIILKRFNYQ